MKMCVGKKLTSLQMFWLLTRRKHAFICGQHKTI